MTGSGWNEKPWLTPEYKAYLKGPKWAMKRTECLKANDFKCQICGYHASQVHHRHYRTLFNEDVRNDLMAVCGQCHREIERQKDLDRVEQYAERKAMALRNRDLRTKYRDLREKATKLCEMELAAYDYSAFPAPTAQKDLCNWDELQRGIDWFYTRHPEMQPDDGEMYSNCGYVSRLDIHGHFAKERRKTALALFKKGWTRNQIIVKTRLPKKAISDAYTQYKIEKEATT
jgi:hypothetical protein